MTSAPPSRSTPQQAIGTARLSRDGEAAGDMPAARPQTSRGFTLAGFRRRLGAERAAVRFDVDKGRAVKAIQSPHDDGPVLDPNQPHKGRPDRIRPDGRPQGKGADSAAVAFWALQNEVAPASVKPVKHLDRRIIFEPLKRVVPVRIEHQPAFRTVLTPLPRTGVAVDPRRADDADETQSRSDAGGSFTARSFLRRSVAALSLAGTSFASWLIFATSVGTALILTRTSARSQHVTARSRSCRRDALPPATEPVQA